MTDNLTHLRIKRLEARVQALEAEVGLEDPDAAAGDEEELEEEEEVEEEAPAPRAAKKAAKKATKKAAGRR